MDPKSTSAEEIALLAIGSEPVNIPSGIRYLGQYTAGPIENPLTAGIPSNTWN